MRKPLIEDGFALTVHRVVTAGGERRPEPGKRYPGKTTWWLRNGEAAGSVGHTVEISADDVGRLTLTFVSGGRTVRQSFEIFGRPCRFGGYRWLARCPSTRRPVANLYSYGGSLFQTRRSIDSVYRSQDRVPATEKLGDREVAILRRLGADDHSPPTPPKPKWMRWPTYGRLIRDLRRTRLAHGLGLARDLYERTGLDLTDGEVPVVRARCLRTGRETG